MYRTDKVFFLTRLGYRESVICNNQFTPEVEIVGNGVSSEIFYPLSTEEKIRKRKLEGFGSSEILITWMANSRPVKGIHLFEKMIPALIELDPRIKIIIIGNAHHLKWKSDRLIQKGRLNPPQVAEILQVSDFYFFTSLWKEGFGLSLVEAIKCGNFIVSSRNGGIADVVGGYERVRFIEDPNIIASWITEFGNIISSDSWRDLDEKTRNSLFDFFSLKSWEDRIRNGLK
ncbi:glycosyltransferase family 4 protein [Algoriphagus lacus]